MRCDRLLRSDRIDRVESAVRIAEQRHLAEPQLLRGRLELRLARRSDDVPPVPNDSSSGWARTHISRNTSLLTFVVGGIVAAPRVRRLRPIR